MAELDTAVVDLQFDISEAVAEIGEVSTVLMGLKNEFKSIATTISQIFQPIIDNLSNIRLGIDSMNMSLASSTTALSGFLAPVEKAQQSGGIFDSVISGFNSLVQVVTSLEKTDTAMGKVLNLFDEVATAPNISSLVDAIFSKTTDTVIFDTVSAWMKKALLPAVTGALSNLGGGKLAQVRIIC